MIDFYFKFLCQKHFDGIIDIPGKKYGTAEFDAFREISWDFKVDQLIQKPIVSLQTMQKR